MVKSRPLLTIIVAAGAASLLAWPGQGSAASPGASAAASTVATNTAVPTQTRRATNTPVVTNTPRPTNTSLVGGTALPTVTPTSAPDGQQLTATAQAVVGATQGAAAATLTAVSIIATFQAQSTATLLTATAVAALTPIPTDTPFPIDTPFFIDTPFATDTPIGSPTPAGTIIPGPSATPNPSTSHDARYFAQTGFRIDDDNFWNYFNLRGGVNTFGYPTSREFLFLGFQTQFFQRRVMQLGPDGAPRLLNLFDQSLFPYTTVNGSIFPAADSSLVASAPQPGSPTYPTDILRFVQQNAPEVYNGKPVNFFSTFNHTVSLAQAFPTGTANPALLPSFDLEMWGAVTSHPAADPNNPNFVYLRFQRGVMMYDTSANATQAVLLADYFKAIVTGIGVPSDLAAAAQQSNFYNQYNDGMPNGLNQPALLPNTNMAYAFDPE